MIFAKKALKFDLNENDIVATHRLPSRNQSGPKNIICKFVCRWKKDNLMKMRRELNDSQFRDIQINHDLSQYKAKLAFFCRKLKREGKIRKTTSHYGKIVITSHTGQYQEIHRLTDLAKYGYTLSEDDKKTMSPMDVDEFTSIQSQYIDQNSVDMDFTNIPESTRNLGKFRLNPPTSLPARPPRTSTPTTVKDKLARFEYSESQSPSSK